MIKVIGFDLDDTLWEVAPLIRRAEAVLGKWLSEHVSTLQYDMESMRGLGHEILAANPDLAHQLTELRRSIIESAIRLSGIDNANDLSHQAIEIFLQERNRVEFFPGAEAVLQQLATRFTLCALSNGNADIKRLGLDYVFSFAFSAEQVGAAKPAPLLFQKALGYASIVPAQMVYVGDDPLLDIDAAKNLGIKAVWLNHGKNTLGKHQPDAIIHHIAELPEAAMRLQSGF